MTERTCAHNSTTFQKLRYYYENREEAPRKHKERGGLVLAVMGCDVPDEILLAGNFFPLRICAGSHIEESSPAAYLEYAFDPIIRRQFTRLVSGYYDDFTDLLAISNSSDVLIRIYYYLRELNRMGEGVKTEPVFIDWLFTHFMIHEERNEWTLHRFIHTLEEIHGATISEKALRDACVIMNNNRAVLREFAALRTPAEGLSRITGPEALIVTGAGFFMEREEHTALVKALCKEAADWPVVHLPKIFYTGSIQEDTVLYEDLLSAGLNVVAEDHDWGSRSFHMDVDLSFSPVPAIVERYMLRMPSSKKAGISERTQALLTAVGESCVEGVIFYLNEYDDAASWDYPVQKKHLDEKGIPSAFFSRMPYPYEPDKQITQGFTALAGMVKEVVR